MSRAHLIGATLALAILAPAEREIHATGSSANVVFEWNQILQDTVPVPHNLLTPRFFAMTHIAMFDAINAIEREFEPYRVRVRSLGYGSPDAAAAQAAHDVLVVINPSATAVYDAALARQLGDRPSIYTRWGAAVGAKVAREILAWRQNDGWVVSPFPPYSEPPVPGRWQKTSAANAARLHASAECRAAGAGQPDAVPAAAPADAAEPALRRRSERGHADRTIEQRDAHARADDDRPAVGRHRRGGYRHRDQLHVDLERHRPRRGARARAVAGRDRPAVRAGERLGARRAADHQASKFVYRHVASGDGDSAGRSVQRHTPGSDLDAAAPDTPPYPSYAGNMATIGASAARALQLVFRTNDIAGDGDLEAIRGRGRLARLRRILAGRRGAVREPHLWRHSLPVRPGRRPADRQVDGGVRVRELHDAPRSVGRLTDRARIWR